MFINRYFLPCVTTFGILGVHGMAFAQSIDVPHHPVPSSQANVKPQSMIVMSNDHQLFYKAYTDFSDLDGDGDIDDTYSRRIRYYGYFDSEGCYEYVTSLTGEYFSRDKDTDDDFECDDGDDLWSGNFLNWATMTRMDILRKVLYGGKRHRDSSTQSTILERAFLPLDAHSFAKVITNDDIIEDNTPFRTSEITICNTTYSSGGYSKDVSNPPLIRVARGKWPKWSANERWQCVWRNEKNEGFQDDRPRRGNGGEGLGEEDYHARVEVCVDDDDTTCQSYPDSAYDKPVGLLHEYADSIDFGLVSGSYEKNKKGGVLRSNVRSFLEELNVETGAFKPEASGIVSNIDAFRISRYDFSTGLYANDGCEFGIKEFNNGECSSWGNPLAEMTLEAIRYLTGEDSPTTAFSVGSGDVETAYVSGLTSPPWDNQVSDNWCAAHSMILVNASEASFDADELGGWSELSSGGVKSRTNSVGDAEGLSGDYFVGETASEANKQCTAKDIGGLGSVLGVCPTAPGLEGSYNVAGLANHVYENQVVLNPDDEDQGGNITTYAVRLSSNIPEIRVRVRDDDDDDDDDGAITIVPACESYSTSDDNAANGDGRDVDPSRVGKCAIVDFQITEPADYDDGEVSGEFRVVWEDSEFGGDYDSDLVMTLRYELDDDELKIRTRASDQSTSQIMGVGYILSGTDDDGFHAHSGINGYNRSDCVGPGNGNNNKNFGCYDNDSDSEREYEVSNGSSGSFLRPPLYYAAKYGNDGVNDDGSPSAYFEVSQIGELVESLEEVLDQVLRSSARSGAGVAFSASEDFIFQTIYNNRNSWSGDLLAFKVTDNGISNEADWSARETMPSADERTIITWLGDRGIPFRMQGELEPFVDYLRGDASNEQRNGGPFRNRLWLDGRAAAPLGDIIGSQPYYVGPPNTYHVPQDGDTSYADFRASHAKRTPMVYVGANDGMLHGFNAETGVEELAYIPGLILEAEENFGALAELINPGYQHRYYVDGSPTVLDARFDDDWISLLASGLGSGGKGIFALDVTDPSSFSENNARNIALWEFGPDDDDELDGGEHLGYVYDKPSIVQMENGEHAVVFGNGYFSKSGKASLYILPVDAYDDGEWDEDEVHRLTPDHDANSGVNGLSSVSMIDSDGNGRVDLAYAGDLQGNVWRFDLSDESDGDWDEGVSLLFSAESEESDDSVAQVITTGLEVGRNLQGDIMVYFGTGGPEGESTPTSESDDTLYALKDDEPFNPGNTLTRDDLDERELILTRQDVRYFPIDNNYRIDTVENGWFIDLPPRERVVSSPLLRGDRIIFTTLIPGIGMCGAEDEGYLYELNAYKGNSFNNPVLDIDGDGEVTAGDTIDVNGNQVVPVGIKTPGALFTPVVRMDSDKQSETKISGNTAGELTALKERPVNLIPLGRASWRVLE